jgi:hypothetical protein
MRGFSSHCDVVTVVREVLGAITMLALGSFMADVASSLFVIVGRRVALQHRGAISTSAAIHFSRGSGLVDDLPGRRRGLEL